MSGSDSGSGVPVPSQQPGALSKVAVAPTVVRPAPQPLHPYPWSLENVKAWLVPPQLEVVTHKDRRIHWKDVDRTALLTEAMFYTSVGGLLGASAGMYYSRMWFNHYAVNARLPGYERVMNRGGYTLAEALRAEPGFFARRIQKTTARGAAILAAYIVADQGMRVVRGKEDTWNKLFGGTFVYAGLRQVWFGGVKYKRAFPSLSFIKTALVLAAVDWAMDRYDIHMIKFPSWVDPQEEAKQAAADNAELEAAAAAQVVQGAPIAVQPLARLSVADASATSSGAKPGG